MRIHLPSRANTYLTPLLFPQCVKHAMVFIKGSVYGCESQQLRVLSQTCCMHDISLA